MTNLTLIGHTLGRYEILAELGRGGMGVVYKARQTDLDRIVALKILPPELTYHSEYIHRFHHEARNVAKLEHPHIVPIYDSGEIPCETLSTSFHFIAMKYIQGYTLKEEIHRQAKLSVQHSLDIVFQVGEALDYAHQQGVLHRDVKPSNVMITDEGWVYLTDFGMARDIQAMRDVTKTGMVVGTPEYMAPEQAQGLPNIGAAADVYALGVVLYEMLTGDFPFAADTPMEMLAARLFQSPRPLHTLRGDIPPAIEQVVMQSLARDPKQRFARISAMMAALQYAASDGMFETISYAQQANMGPTVVLPQQVIPQAVQQPEYAQQPPSVFRTPMGVITTLLVLFLMIAGWFRITSLIHHPKKPTPDVPPVTRTPKPATMTPHPHSQELDRLIDSGLHLLERDKDKEAEQLFRTAVALDPNSYEATMGLGESLRRQNQYREAAQQFTTSLALKDDYYTHYTFGLNFYDQQDYQNAEDHFRKAIRLHPDFADTYFYLGETLAALGHNRDAVQAYQQALDLGYANESQVNGALQRLKSRGSGKD